MARIEQSWSKANNCKSIENTALTSLIKQDINVNVKNLKTRKNSQYILLIILIILLFLVTILLIILIITLVSEKTFLIETTQNVNANAKEMYKMFERKQKFFTETTETFDGKMKDFELMMDNVMLKLKYTEQNLNIIRNRLSMGISYLKSKSESSTYNSDLSETENDSDSDSNTTSELDDPTTPSASVQLLNHQNNEIESNIGKILDIYPTSPIKLSKNNSIEIEELSRQKRTILDKAQNYMIMESERNNNYTAVVQRVSRAIKERRNRGRGKKQQKKKEKRSEKEKRRRAERNRGRLGPKVVTFIGAIPQQEFKNTVYIGPWIKRSKNIKSNNTSYDFTKFYLREEDYSIEVNMSGLYTISVQIFYVGGPMNSYWVLLNSEGASTKRKLITCAVGSTTSEVSCYTSVTTCLQKGDRLSILQQEKDRLVNLREGYSQIQLVLLDAND